MKRFILLSLVIISMLNGYSQDNVKDTIRLNAEGIVNIEGKKAIELFNSSREWFATTFKSSKDVIQLADKEMLKIIGKGSQPYIVKRGWVPVTLNYDFTLNLQFKDGRYKYLFVGDNMQNGQYIPQNYEEFKATMQKFGSNYSESKMQRMYNQSMKDMGQIVKCQIDIRTNIITSLTTFLTNSSNSNW